MYAGLFVGTLIIGVSLIAASIIQVFAGVEIGSIFIAIGVVIGLVGCFTRNSNTTEAYSKMAKASQKLRRFYFSPKIHNYFIELSYFVLYNIKQSNIRG